MNEEKGQKTIEVSLTKALAILSGAVLTAIVGTAFAVVSTLNTDHFSLVALSAEVEANQQKDNTDHTTFVTKEDLGQLVIVRLDRIESKLDRLIESK